MVNEYQKRPRGVYQLQTFRFLGDSVIGTVVANYLYSELQEDNEGELTRMRSKIVSRKIKCHWERAQPS